MDSLRSAVNNFMRSENPVLVLVSIVLVVPVFAYVPSVVHRYSIPKELFLLVSGPLAFFLMSYLVYKGKSVLFVSVPSVILAIRLGWIFLTSPSWATTPSTIDPLVEASCLLILVSVGTLSYALLDEEGTSRMELFLKFLHVTWISGVVLAVIGFYQAFLVGQAQFDISLAKTPMRGTIRLVNGYASFLAIGAASALVAMWFVDENDVKGLLALGCSVQLVAIVMNGSRGALLGFVGACAVGVAVHVIACVYRADRHAPSVLVKPLVLALRKWAAAKYVVVALVLGAMGGAGFTLHQLSPESGRGRLIEWEVSLPMIADHPVFGVGKGRFGPHFIEYQADYFSREENKEYDHKANTLYFSHNDFFGAFVETGTLGGILYFLLILYPFYYFAQRVIGGSKDYYLCILPYSAVVGHALVSYTLHTTVTYVFVILLIGLSVSEGARFRVGKWGGGALLALSLLLLGALAPYSWNRYQGMRNWTRARGADFEESLTYLRKAKERLPENGYLMSELGEAELRVGNYDRAIELFERASERYARKDPRVNLCKAYLYHGDLEQSKRCSKRILRAFGELLEPRYVLAKAYHLKGEHEKAKQLLQRCIEERTYFDSPAVRRIVKKSTLLWKTLYGNVPKRFDTPGYLDQYIK